MLVVSSGAIALGRTVLGFRTAPCASRKARPPPPSGRSRSRASGPRRSAHDGITAGQVLLDARRHRGAPPLSQRARDARQASRVARRAVVNENDTVATSRDPLWRQRPPRRARRHHGGADLPDPALRCRRALRRRRLANDPTAKLIPLVERITPEIEAMAGGAGVRTIARRHAHQDRGGAASRRGAGTHMVIADGRQRNPLKRIARGRALHLVPDASPTRAPRARPGSPARSSPRARSSSTPAPSRRSAAARACCRPASRGSRASSRAATRCSIRDPRGAEIGRGLVAYDAEDAERIIGRSTRRYRRSWARAPAPK